MAAAAAAHDVTTIGRRGHGSSVAKQAPVLGDAVLKQVQGHSHNMPATSATTVIPNHQRRATPTGSSERYGFDKDMECTVRIRTMTTAMVTPCS
jgi:hypothetical protein